MQYYNTLNIRSILILLFFLCFTFKSFSQELIGKKVSMAYHDSKNIGLGYHYSFSDSNPKSFHLLEINLNRTGYGGAHGGGFSYGLGTEIGLNTHNFTVGPKISGVMYYQFLVFGSEFVMYTDFDKATLRYVPILGIGGEKFRLTINPHVILTNKKFKPVGRGSVSLVINLSFQRKPVNYKN